MSTQRECNCKGPLERLPDLRDRLQKILTPLSGAIKELSARPQEFDRRVWLSWVDSLMDRVWADYQRWQDARQRVQFLCQFTTMAVGLALKAAGQQPGAPVSSPPVVIVLLPDGQVHACASGDFASRPDVVELTWERFTSLARQVKEGIQRGQSRLEKETQVGALIRRLAQAQVDSR